MKKYQKAIAVFLLAGMALLILAGCGGKKVSREDADVMAGNWQLMVYDYYGVKMLPADEETEMSFVFKDNGKATFTLNGEAEDYKWEKDNDLITIWVKDGAVSRGRTAVLDGDSFTLYWKHNEEPIEMIYAREGSEAANPDLYIKEGDITSTMLKNADESNILALMEKMTPEARDAFELSELYDTLKNTDGAENAQ